MECLSGAVSNMAIQLSCEAVVVGLSFALFALGVFWIVVRTTGLVYEMKSVQDVVEFLRGPSPFILGGIASLFVVLGMNFYCGKDTSKSDLPLLK